MKSKKNYLLIANITNNLLFIILNIYNYVNKYTYANLPIDNHNKT